MRYKPRKTKGVCSLGFVVALLLSPHSHICTTCNCYCATLNSLNRYTSHHTQTREPLRTLLTMGAPKARVRFPAQFLKSGMALVTVSQQFGGLPGLLPIVSFYSTTVTTAARLPPSATVAHQTVSTDAYNTFRHLQLKIEAKRKGKGTGAELVCGQYRAYQCYSSGSRGKERHTADDDDDVNSVQRD